jgi:phosphate-selective porin OprO/OprP
VSLLAASAAFAAEEAGVVVVDAPGPVAAEDTNVVAAVQADEEAGWESVFVEDNRVPFHINFYVKDGLYYEFMETSEYEGVFFTKVFSEKRRFTGRLGAKMHLDAAFYKDDGTFPPMESGNFSIRRFRVNTFGRGFFLSPLTYGLEFGIADGDFFFNDGYIWFHQIPYISSFKLGIFTSPMSLESLQSSSSIPLMEKSAPVSAFAPGDLLGFQVGGAFLDQRGTFFTGWFADVNDNETSSETEGYSRLMARATWLLAGKKEESERLIHLGASGSYLVTARDGVQYSARPESYLAPILIDTGAGNLDGDFAVTYGLEAAMQRGPLTLHGEFLRSFVDDAASQTHHFGGVYATVGWMLTGETRPYNRGSGFFSRVEPKNDFSFRNRTWGAWELAARLSHTDLTDQAIQGGIMSVASGGFNIYLTKRNRIMFDVGAADVRDSALYDGLLYIGQMRLQIEL